MKTEEMTLPIEEMGTPEVEAEEDILPQEAVAEAEGVSLPQVTAIAETKDVYPSRAGHWGIKVRPRQVGAVTILLDREARMGRKPLMETCLRPSRRN